MIYRARPRYESASPAGGTDVSPYSDIYGGAVLNATISLYARASIEPLSERKIVLQTLDQGLASEYGLHGDLPIDGNMDLLKAVANHFRSRHRIDGGSACAPMWTLRPDRDSDRRRRWR